MSQGNVFAHNPDTGVFGPVCSKYFGMDEVCPRFGFLLHVDRKSIHENFVSQKIREKNWRDHQHT